MTEPTTTPRRRMASTRAVLAATVELLEEVGYRSTTVEAIARRAGVGKQTIYRWWNGSKADLVLDAFIGIGPQRVPAPDTGNVGDDLRAILHPVFALNAIRGRGTALANRTLMAEAQLDPEFAATYARLHASWWGALRDAVERGVHRGELRDSTDPQVIVDLLLGAAWYRLLLGHAPLDNDAADQLVDTVLNGARR